VEEAARQQGGEAARTMAMTNVFAVIGEHREQPERLLLLGGDGRYYTYGSAEGPPVEVKPTEEWELDEVVVEALFV
jgi:hypothetical protein